MKGTSETKLRPYGGWPNTCLSLRRRDERGILQIDDDLGTVAGCGVMPSVIDLPKSQAIARLREKGWVVK